MKLLSINICTFNRSRLLKKCLDSLLSQVTEELEILIIDNNSSDDTALVVSEYIKRQKNIRYVCEPEIGLSHARNRGIKESRADWILYLDDDAIAFPDLIERTFYLIETADFDCVGGMYYGYFEGNRPKWVHNDWGTKLKYSDQLTECPYYIPHGGIVLYRKNVLLKSGEFNTSLGMKGNMTGYAEEVELQERIFRAGYKIGFDPLLKIWHLNKPESFGFRKMLWNAYYHGRDNKFIHKENIFIVLIKFIASFAALIFKRIPKSIIKITIVKNYYWQNMLIDSLYPNIFYLGLLKSKIT